MRKPGRPRTITVESVIQAGITLTLPKVTIRGMADELGVSEMSIYRIAGDIAGLRTMIADGLVEQADFSVPVCDTMEESVAGLALRLRTFVLDNPGIAWHLAHLGPNTPKTLAHIERSQAAFAKQWAIEPYQASLLLSTVAEHAIALAAINPVSHSKQRERSAFGPNLPTIYAGAQAATRFILPYVPEGNGPADSPSGAQPSSPAGAQPSSPAGPHGEMPGDAHHVDLADAQLSSPSDTPTTGDEQAQPCHTSAVAMFLWSMSGTIAGTMQMLGLPLSKPVDALSVYGASQIPAQQ